MNIIIQVPTQNTNFTVKCIIACEFFEFYIRRISAMYFAKSPVYTLLLCLLRWLRAGEPSRISNMRTLARLASRNNTEE